MPPLLDATLHLAAALGAPTTPAARASLQDFLASHDLSDDGAAPEWLLALLGHLADRVTTPQWIRFEIQGLEASDSFDFLRALGSVLPVHVRDEEERWVIVADALAFEAHLSFEGYLWLTKPIGAPEPDEDP